MRDAVVAERAAVALPPRPPETDAGEDRADVSVASVAGQIAVGGVEDEVDLGPGRQRFRAGAGDRHVGGAGMTSGAREWRTSRGRRRCGDHDGAGPGQEGALKDQVAALAGAMTGGASGAVEAAQSSAKGRWR